MGGFLSGPHPKCTDRYILLTLLFQSFKVCMFSGTALPGQGWRAGVNERFGVFDMIKGLSDQLNLASFV